MATPKNLKLSQDEVSQTFDLKEIFGVDVSRNEALKQAFTQSLIDQMLDRTKSGVDYDGAKFKGYSASYMASRAFHAFGKDKNVDMELSGEMLGSLDILKSNGNTVTIGLTGEQAAKAYGHMTGMKGHPTLEGVTPERKWFGIVDAEVTEIAKSYKPSGDNGGANKADDSIVSKLMSIFEKKGGTTNGNDSNDQGT